MTVGSKTPELLGSVPYYFGTGSEQLRLVLASVLSEQRCQRAGILASFHPPLPMSSTRVMPLSRKSCAAPTRVECPEIFALRAAGKQATPQSPDAALLRQSKTAPTVDEARTSGQLILVAEDNAVNRKVIVRQLNVLGYAADTANDGVLALEAWRSGSYALLLCDCHMPNLDGYGLTSAVREAEGDGAARMPIIAVTANALVGEAEKCRAAGMDDYLTKPLDMDKLRTMLDKWMPRGDEAGHRNAG